VPRVHDDLTAVEGLAVGQASDLDRTSGVSVVVFERGAPSVVDVRGGASATYDTASLALEATFGRRWAIFLAGGSLFGLDAARGVRTRLLETGAGTPAFERGPMIVPISGAALYDLRGPDEARPEYLALGYEATRLASRRPVAQGRIGAGTGATVGKYLGRRWASLGGVGSAGARLSEGGHVGVLVAVNSVGAVRDPESGAWHAGARDRRGRLVPPGGPPSRTRAARGTTLTIVATDLEVERTTLARVASIVHAGLARTIVPYLTATDGDVVFASTTGRRKVRGAAPAPGRTADRLGTAAAELAVRAVARAVQPG
jgi:L-aminopeptidase/D-esterase-like protein